jgi:hypothetical protein
MATRDQQHQTVGEGLAIGCLNRNVVAVPQNSLRLDAAFASAWENWPRRTEFPDVRASFPHGLNDLQEILRHSQCRQDRLAAWRSTTTTPGQWQPDREQDRPLEQLAQDLDSTVGLDEWTELAEGFLNSLGQDKVWYGIDLASRVAPDGAAPRPREAADGS